MKKILIACAVVAVIGALVYGIISYTKPTPNVPTPVASTTDTSEASTPTPTQQAKPVASKPEVDTTKTVIGTSVSGNPITAYHYGSGKDELLFIGGMHGGYEWNTALLGYELMDYLSANPNVIPKNIKVTIIPVLNPDGLKKVTGSTGRFEAKDVSKNETTLTSGRFNANTVDLNRNFDCDWKKEGIWQTKKVSGGSEAFSEPESQAIKTYVEAHTPVASLVWYSSAGGVFASSCHNGVSQKTSMLTKKFAEASGYPAHESFDFYATTGDMVNWFAKNNIPAISILLTNHTDTEFAKNKAGIIAILKYFTK